VSQLGNDDLVEGVLEGLERGAAELPALPLPDLLGQYRDRDARVRLRQPLALTDLGFGLRPDRCITVRGRADLPAAVVAPGLARNELSPVDALRLAVALPTKIAPRSG
jgi:hypothetical protein